MDGGVCRTREEKCLWWCGVGSEGGGGRRGCGVFGSVQNVTHIRMQSELVFWTSSLHSLRRKEVKSKKKTKKNVQKNLTHTSFSCLLPEPPLDRSYTRRGGVSRTNRREGGGGPTFLRAKTNNNVSKMSRELPKHRSVCVCECATNISLAFFTSSSPSPPPPSPPPSPLFPPFHGGNSHEEQIKQMNQPHIKALPPRERVVLHPPPLFASSAAFPLSLCLQERSVSFLGTRAAGCDARCLCVFF